MSKELNIGDKYIYIANESIVKYDYDDKTLSHEFRKGDVVTIAKPMQNSVRVSYEDGGTYHFWLDKFDELFRPAYEQKESTGYKVDVSAMLKEEGREQTAAWCMWMARQRLMWDNPRTVHTAKMAVAYLAKYIELMEGQS